MRLKVQPTLRASARASMVLPVPGTSSMRICPRLSTAIRASSISVRLPTITRSTLAMIRDATAESSSDIGASLKLRVPFGLPFHGLGSRWRSVLGDYERVYRTAVSEPSGDARYGLGL